MGDVEGPWYIGSIYRRHSMRPMEIDDLDLDTLKALARRALEQLEDPFQSTFALEENQPKALDTQEFGRSLESMDVSITGDFEGDVTAYVSTSAVKDALAELSESVEPLEGFIADGIQQEQERFLGEFQSALHLTVAHPQLMGAVSAQQWWERAAGMGVLKECFTALFQTSTVQTAGDWLLDSPAMHSEWSDLGRAWGSIGDPARQVEWLGLLVETPTHAKTYHHKGSKPITTNPADVRARFFEEAWQSAQTSALLARRRQSDPSMGYQRLANALMASGEVTCGLESLAWERVFYDHRQPLQTVTSDGLLDQLSGLKSVPPALLNQWLETPDDAPVNWSKAWGSSSSFSHSSVEHAVRQAKNSPRKLIWPEVQRLAQKVAQMVKSPELEEDYVRAFRGFALDRLLPDDIAPAAGKPRF